MNGKDLTALRDKIEGMDHIHQVGILEIVRKGKIDYTENSNGVFINMTILSEHIIYEIKDYIKYIKLQQEQLDETEQDKEHLKNEFYKDNKASGSYN